MGDATKMQLPVLVDFWAVSCSACNTMASRVAQLADQYEGRAVVGMIDAQNNPASVSEYGIESVPTILIFQNGQLVEIFIGIVPTATLANALDNLLGSSSN
ncbi:MAG TPA: thioredoxin domain-containing protein [Thermoanaerobaculia bacterium]|nr:thioredoxin domain-containing protein [Thermoanaerobaculia bacterium]